MNTSVSLAQQPVLEERAFAGLHDALACKLMTIPGLSLSAPVLDIGCGTGAWLERLSTLGFTRLYGADIDRDQFGASHGTFIQADIDTQLLTLGDLKFGLITAIEVIEHLENPGRLLAQVREYLDDSGVFVITTPNIHSVLARFRFFVTGRLKQFDAKGDPTHIYPVLLTALERVLPRYQLTIADSWPYPSDKISVSSRPALALAAAVLRGVLPEQCGGDTLCLLIRKQVQSA